MNALTNKLSIIMIPTILVVIVAVVLLQLIQPLVKPAISAFERALESLQVAHAAAPKAPKFPLSADIGDVFNGARWFTIGNGLKSYNCRPTASLHLGGYYVDHKEPFDGECDPDKIGKFLQNFFDKILNEIKDAPSGTKETIMKSIDALREAAIKQGVKFSTPTVPPAP